MVGFELDRQYELLSLLGAGGMGFVYLARQLKLGREVAVKMLYAERIRDPANRERFHREARALASLDHPNVVRVHAFGEAHGTVPYLVMEHLRGHPLDVVIQRFGPLHPHHALDIGAQLADALAAAHRAGVVHRDLKPENVQLEREGGELRVRVLDFGLVLLSEAVEDQRLTRQGVVFGTPEYMAPEQIRLGEADARSDLYALGVLLYEMLTGRAPFRGDQPSATFAQHLTNPPPPLADDDARTTIPPQVEELVLSLLEKHPDDRPENAETIGTSIRAVLNEIASPGEPPVVLTNPSRADDSRTLSVETESEPAPHPAEVTDTGFEGLMGTQTADHELRTAITADSRRRRVRYAFAGGILLLAAIGVVPPVVRIVVAHTEENGIAAGTGQTRLRPLPALQRFPRPESPLRAPRTSATQPGGPSQALYEATLRSVDQSLLRRGLRRHDCRAHPDLAVLWSRQASAAAEMNFDRARERLLEFERRAASVQIEDVMAARLARLQGHVRDANDPVSRAALDALTQSLGEASQTPSGTLRFMRRADEIEGRAR